jgi:hypothetical protein
MTRAARAATAAAVALACTAQSSAPPAQPLSGDAILARVKTVFRAYARPPYVAYTLVRRDRHDGAPDLANSYTLKIWCRTADRSALVRHAWRGKAYGGLENITVMFDRAVDPGPPTADMFEKRLFGAVSARGDAATGDAPATGASRGAGGTPPVDAPTAGDVPREIGRVTARDGDYRAPRWAPERGLLHLWLEPRTDPDRNRLDEIWVDATTYDLRRARVRDHLYFGFGGPALDDEFDVRFRPGPGNLPLIASIHGQTRYGEFETDYTYEDVTFPDTLPDWYFTPALYGLHRGDAPT